jgi:signal transduction histidine kinase
MRRLVAQVRRHGHRSPWLIDLPVAVLLFALVAVPLSGPVAAGAVPAGPVAYLLAAAVAAPYALHRRWPLPAVAVSSAALVLYSAGHYVGYPGFATFGLVFGVALHGERRQSLLAYAGSLVALSTALALQPRELADTSSWVTSLLTLTVAWLAGENLRGRRARWAALEERARRLEVEREVRARQAVDEERMRIARELHDVVAHSMSVVAVQAGVAHHVIDSRPELAKQTLSTIETTSRAALVEMRRMLGVLRHADDPDGTLTPAPGLDDIAALCAGFAEAGLEVALQTDGDPLVVPSGAQLSAYRIVQESLTNALKHGGPQARVLVAASPDLVELEVVSSGSPRTPSGSVPGAGQGLVGMRERVALFGGVLDAGATPDGGFRVHATLPCGEPPPLPDGVPAQDEPAEST